jgi:hypothetical protein
MTIGSRVTSKTCDSLGLFDEVFKKEEIRDLFRKCIKRALVRCLAGQSRTHRTHDRWVGQSPEAVAEIKTALAGKTH